MKRFACLSFILVAACGDDGGTAIDAANIDAAVDAAVDAPIDAAPTVYGGTFTALETTLLNPTGAATPIFGQGLQIGISFSDSVTGVAATMEEQPGSPLGCKLFNFNRAQAIQSSVGNNEGDVTVAITGGTNPQTPPNVPVCKFTANVGYTCAFNMTAGAGGTIAVAVPGQAGSLTVAAPGAFNDGNSLGSYVSITGATNAANNGTFPIIQRPAANIIVYGNPAAAAETLPAAATHVNLAGIGPIPGKADPGFLADDSAASFTLAPGGGNHFQVFTAMTANVGDDFTLSAAEQAKLNALPTNGAAFTIDCAAGGGTCGTASGALLNIVTTDTAPGASPFAMPLPTTKRVQIRCAAIGRTDITVPAAYMAAIMTSGFTRIQTTYMRPALMSGGPATVNALGGHAIVGFTNRPAN